MTTTTKDDPRLRKVRTPAAGPDVKRILKTHKEAIVITVDPEPGTDGEANLAVFTKLAKKNGVLSSYLEQVLTNLLRNKHGKQPHRTGEAPTGA